AAYELVLIHWEEFQGQIGGPTFATRYYLDSTGRPFGLESAFDVAFHSKATEELNLVYTTPVFHALARMNCRNVELRPITEGKIRQHSPSKVKPASVWHEIKITSVPKIQTTGRGAFGVPDD